VDGGYFFRNVVKNSPFCGLSAPAGHPNYSAAKAGVVGLTRAMSKEWGRYRVNVNCVAFGLIQTRLIQPLKDEGATIQVGDHEIPVGIHEDNLAMMSSVIPLGRAGTPQEAAGAVYLFCIPESNYVSGQVITCSGGLRS
jgi:3-oxoacyl-[acyl-carrier protein] reductase